MNKVVLTFCISFIVLSSTLSQYSDSISVNYFLLDECIITIQMTIEMNDVYEEYDSEQVNFTGYFPNFSSKKIAIQEFTQKYSIEFPIKTDYFKHRARLLGATVMPEVVVYDEVNETVLYIGRIDNTYLGVGKRRRNGIKRDLWDVLDAIKSGREIDVKSSSAIGCFINFEELN